MSKWHATAQDSPGQWAHMQRPYLLARVYWPRNGPHALRPSGTGAALSLFHCNVVEQIKMGAGCSCWRSIYRCVCDCVYLVALMPLAANLSISAGSEATVQPAAHVSAPFFAQKFQQQAQEQALLGCISCYQQMLRRKLNILLHRKILMMHSGDANDAIFFHFCASTAPSWFLAWPGDKPTSPTAE